MPGSTAQGLDYEFHDFKKQGVPADKLPSWMQAVGWEKLTNRQEPLGANWTQPFSPAWWMQPALRRVSQEHPSAIKRPVVEWADGDITVGFNAENWLASRV